MILYSKEILEPKEPMKNKSNTNNTNIDAFRKGIKHLAVIIITILIIFMMPHIIKYANDKNYASAVSKYYVSNYNGKP